MKKNLLAIVAVALLAGPMAANAIIITWDDLNPTVVRPASGTTFVDFFATVTLDPGEILRGASNRSACLSQTECLLLGFGDDLFAEGHGLRFRQLVDSTDPLGLYDSGPMGFNYIYSNAAGAFIATEWGRYTVNLVDRVTVPEPGTLALFGLGLAALGFARRRRPN